MQVALLGNPFAVEQHLQGGTQGGEAKTLVFHFNDDRVVVGISNVGQVIQTAVRDRAGAENRLVVLEEVDDLVVAHLLSHVFSLPVSGLAAGLSLYPSLSLLYAPCWCDTHLGLSIASNEHERPGFRDEHYPPPSGSRPAGGG